MARLERMSIHGIRSFGADANDAQYIRFTSPITLIRGDNGCGKTTIIEALKYATTGDLPPGCNKGQSFVHDPKIARQVETRGQVRLEVSNTKGKIVVTRSMQVTQKAKSMTFKTLDTTLVKTLLNQEPVSVSGRCIDVDAEMCIFLGVSKAVLNNVIFCHQEESCWPLDEGKRLKEKFDSIFEATKYNKCLDQIKKERKKYSDQVKFGEKDIERLKSTKEVAEGKKKALEDARKRITDIKESTEKNKEKMVPIENDLKELRERESSILSIERKKETAEMKLKAVQERQQELRSSIRTEFIGSTEDLEQAISSFRSQLEAKKGRLDKLEKEIKQAEADETRAREEASAKQGEVGRLQENQVQQQERVQARDRELAGLASVLGVAVPVPVQAERATQLLGLLDDKLNDMQRRIDSLDRESKQLEEQLQKRIDAARDTATQLREQQAMKEQQLTELRTEMSSLLAEIKQVEQSSDRVGMLKRQLEEKNDELKEAGEAVNVEELRGQVSWYLEERKRLEERLQSVDKEALELQQCARLQAEVDMRRESKASKEREIEKLLARHGDTLRRLLKKEVPERGIKEELKACMDRIAKEISSAQHRLYKKQQELTTLETNLRHQREKFAQKEQELRNEEALILEACGNEDLDKLEQSLSKTIQELQDQKGTLTSSEYMFRRYVSKLRQSEPCCPLCHREFDNQDDVVQLINELNGKVGEVPSRLRDNKQKLDEMKVRHTRLVELRPTYQKLSGLRNVTLPELKLELTNTEAQLVQARKDRDALQAALAAPQSDEQMARSVQGDVALLEQHQSELCYVTRELERLEARMPPGGSRRPVQQVTAEQQQLKLQLTSIRQSLETAQAALNEHNEKMHQLRESRNSLKEELLRIQDGTQKKQQLEERLATVQEQERLLRDEVEQLKVQQVSADRTLEATQAEKKRRCATSQEGLNRQRAKLSELSQQADRLQALQTAVQEYEDRCLAQKLAALRECMGRLRKEQQAAADRRQDATKKMVEMRTELASQEVRERELKDNQKLRQKRSEEEELRTELKALVTELTNMNYKSLLARRASLDRQKAEIENQLACAAGQLRELESQVRDLVRELSRDDYKRADEYYNDAVLSVEADKVLVQDLGTYFVAMEWAIMHFHRERMNDINAIIRDLWRQIYRGNDIDYIEIKTDECGGSGADRRRSYNYRVVQMKGDTELDMRGRCSAGQKVLASLIIRMALSEALSTNCGILALDEPTTNLDRSNIDSLCTALGEIVTARKSNRSFQLLVITHDSDFVRNIGQMELVDVFYQVSRNDQSKSVISREQID